MESDTPHARPVKITPQYPDSPPGTAASHAKMVNNAEADAKRLSRAKNNLHRKLSAAKNKRVVKF